MLQQTQVATVLPYFDRFLKSFPTIADLAAAPEEDLMRHWEGLGYYRRARSLHAAAKQIVSQHNGVFPDQYADVLALPGIGRYTVGAILSISGNQKLPILEGNTQRVFARWVALRQSPNDTAANRVLWEIAEAMLPRSNSGQFNQAAMELGALVCTPREPKCAECPIQSYCAAYDQGLELEIPGKVTKVKYEDRTEFAFVVCQNSASTAAKQKYLMRPLPDGGRWAGLWDFPRRTDRTFDDADSAAKDLSSEFGFDVQPGLRLQTIKHAVTKYRISLHVHVGEVSKIRKLTKPWRFVTMSEMADLPMSVTARKITQFLEKNRQPSLPI